MESQEMRPKEVTIRLPKEVGKSCKRDLGDNVKLIYHFEVVVPSDTVNLDGLRKFAGHLKKRGGSYGEILDYQRESRDRVEE